MRLSAPVAYASCDMERRVKGKSGGVRVIYYFYDQDMPIYALLIYGKNERADLKPEQRKAVAAFAMAIKAARKRK